MRHLRSGTSVTTPSTELGSVLLAALLLLLLCIGGPFGFAGSGVAAAAPDPFTVNIVAVDAETGDPIPSFKWLINIDNSHSNSSVTPPASYSPVVASGDESSATGITVDGATPDDRGYLVSVVANDGGGGVNDPDYKIGGQHFSSSGTLVVELVPNPLPLATVRVRVFHDNQLVNAEDDIPLEEGLAGFHVTLNERIGEVTTDWFGNPLCTEYEDIAPPAVFGTRTLRRTARSRSRVPAASARATRTATRRSRTSLPTSSRSRSSRRTARTGYKRRRSRASSRTTPGSRKGTPGSRPRKASPRRSSGSASSSRAAFGNASDDCPTNNNAGTATINGKVRSIALDDESGVILLGNVVRRRTSPSTTSAATTSRSTPPGATSTERSRSEGPDRALPARDVGRPSRPHHQLPHGPGERRRRGRQPRRHRHPALVRDDQGQGLHRPERERCPGSGRALLANEALDTASRTGRSSTRRSRTRTATTSSRRCSSSSTSRSPRSVTGA